MRHTAPTAVVGAGITGAFSAYFLARCGVGVTLIARDPIGTQASGSNPGGLNPLHGIGIPGPLQALALEAFDLHLKSWHAVRELSGIHFSPRRARRIHLATDETDLPQLERTKAQHDLTPGFSAWWLDAGELRAIEPRLSAGVIRGLATEGNAKVSAAEYTQALVAAAVELGASVMSAEVRGLNGREGRVESLTLDSGTLECDGMVLASGPWCVEPSRWLGTPLPVEPLKGEMVLVRLDGGRVGTDLAWRDVAAYGTGGGEIWLGHTEDSVGFDAAPSAVGRRSILERAAVLLPGVGGARLVDHIVGLRPVASDGLPIVGRAPGWENVVLALGAGRKGVLLSAGIGLAVAQLLVNERTEMPIAACDPRRFVDESLQGSSL